MIFSFCSALSGRIFFIADSFRRMFFSFQPSTGILDLFYFTHPISSRMSSTFCFFIKASMPSAISTVAYGL